MNAVIIDDESRNRKTLELLLRQNFPELNVAGQADGVKTGLERISKINPQIIFLDIEMPDGSGFDLLRKVKDYNFEIIFTTAHDEYALDAFRFSAIGYLLKPIAEPELRVSVQKAIQLIQKSNRDSFVNRGENIKALMDNISGKINKLVLPDTDGFHVLPLDEILYLQGDGNYTHLFLKNKRIFHSSHNLGWFESILSNQKFLRISKSHFINLDHVTLYSRKDGGTVVMSNDISLPVSDTKKEELRSRFLF